MESGGHNMLLIRPEFVSLEWANDLIAAFRQIVDVPAAMGVGAHQRAAYLQESPDRTEAGGLAFRQAGMPEVHRQITEVRHQARDIVCQFYGVPGTLYTEYTLVTEMRIGDSHPLHADSVRQDTDGRWVPNHTPWRDYTAMLYLNTSGLDYEGGLLRFPALGEEVVPQAGLLVGFPCGRQYQHEVTAVRQGSRYAISMWMTPDPAHAEGWE
jgi:hypothetical protein